MFLVNSYQFGGGLDPDAQAFLTAAAITDPTITSAIDTLVVQLKADGIWTKMKAIYPMVGGTATTHKFNLKDPRDLDAAFRITFGGGVSHDSLGSTGNGTNGYGVTHLNSFTELVDSNLHLSWYSRTASTAGSFSTEISPNNFYVASSWITFRINNKSSGNAYFSAGSDGVRATVSNTLNGFFVGSETASNLRKLFRNGTPIATNTTNNTTALPNANLRFWGTSIFGGTYSANNCAFSSIGDGLSDAEVSALYTIVQDFQTTLSRQV
jgi:hypothetical protein